MRHVRQCVWRILCFRYNLSYILPNIPTSLRKEKHDMNIIYPTTTADELYDEMRNRYQLVRDKYKSILGNIKKKNEKLSDIRTVSTATTGILIGCSVFVPLVIAAIEDSHPLHFTPYAVPLCCIIIAAIIIGLVTAIVSNTYADKTEEALYQTLYEANEQLKMNGLDCEIHIYDLFEKEAHISPTYVPAAYNIFMADSLRQTIHEAEAQHPDSIEIKSRLNDECDEYQLILELWVNGYKYSEYSFDIKDMSEFCTLTKNDAIDLSIFDKTIEPFMKIGGTVR